MSKSPEVCPKCGHQLPGGSPDPSWCPGCGELCSSPAVVEPPPLPEPPYFEDYQTPVERRRWRICFWLCFLLTPVAVPLFALFPNLFQNVISVPVRQYLQMMTPIGIFGTVALGALGAGYCLAKLHAKPRTTGGLIAATIAFAVGLTVVYAAILFVGCLAIMSQLKF